jgi:cation-dependent mannose-6-phosphate receptor
MRPWAPVPITEHSRRFFPRLQFICDPTTVGSGSPALVAALPPGPPEGQCAFFFDWKTEVACPTNIPITDGSGWSYIGVFAAL